MPRKQNLKSSEKLKGILGFNAVFFIGGHWRSFNVIHTGSEIQVF